jgi:hypothetical protein
VGQVDALARALAEEAGDHVAAVGQGRRLIGGARGVREASLFAWRGLVQRLECR